MHDNIENVETQTPDLALERQRQLRELFPEAWSETGLDFTKLRTLLGDLTDDNPERYRFGWAGKREAIELLQTRSHATLAPDVAASVDFDATRNWFIEGDNLEVLKLLYKPLFGRVKMIYIDPPYNTGNDFIYPDNFSDPLKNYLIQTGQKDPNGDLQNTDLDTAGRVHSRWLSMLYPRLMLARSLLRDDGVIVVSIDDNEVHHLRLLMNEVFGEENFIGTFVINSTPNARDYGHIGKMHEYAHFYSKSVETALTHQLEVKDKTFKYSDSISGFNVHPLYNSNEAFTSKNRPNLYFPIYLYPAELSDDCVVNSTGSKSSSLFKIGFEKKPNSIEIFPPKSEKNGVQFVWRWGKPKCAENFNDEIIGYKTEQGDFRIVQKMRHTTKLIRSLMDSPEVSNRRGTGELEEILKTESAIFPKPTTLLKDFIQVGSSDDDIILDFFAGSGTTAQAVLELNREDGGNRRFVLVQLPEPTGNAQFPTIADIATARITRVIERMKDADNGTLDVSTRETPEDLGFKAWKLTESHFHQLQSTEPGDTAGYLRQLELLNDALLPDSDTQSVLYEVALREGFGLNCDIEPVADLDGVAVWRVSDTEREQRFFISLDPSLELETLRPLKLTQDDLFICRGVALDDDTAANLTLQCRLKMV